MKDFLGKELKIGDKVVYLNYFRTSSNLHRGVITGFTPMKIKIDTYTENGELRWAEKKYPRHVIKVNWEVVHCD